MAGIRIYELSKKLNVGNKEIIARLAELGITAKSHMSNLDEDTAGKLADIFAQKPGVKEKPSPTGIKEEGVKISKKIKPEKEIKPAPAGKILKIKSPVAERPAEISEKKISPATEKDEVVIPDRFKKEVESQNLAKFKKIGRASCRERV